MHAGEFVIISGAMRGERWGEASEVVVKFIPVAPGNGFVLTLTALGNFGGFQFQVGPKRTAHDHVDHSPSKPGLQNGYGRAFFDHIRAP